jgi:hypothetical protein
VSLLPLLVIAAVHQAEYMNLSARLPAGRIRSFARRICAVIAECNYAQRRMAELSTAPDRYLFDPDAAPATYTEFLYRTSGLLQHEPSARARARARASR